MNRLSAKRSINSMKSVYVYALFFCLIGGRGWDTAKAFTLVSSDPPRYTSDEVYLDFTNDACTNTGLSATDLHSMAVQAVDEYWNKVPTSRLILKKGSVRDISSDGLSLNDLASAAEKNRILIGCNDDISSFSTGSVGAVGGIQSLGGLVKGAVLLNDHVDSRLSTLSRAEIVALMAHELGHALGLGHSADETAVMYYSIGGKIQEQLTQDDYDGLSFLYPNDKKLAGLAGSCGTVEYLSPSDKGDGGSGLGFLGSFLTGIFLIMILSLCFPPFRNKQYSFK